MALTRRTGGRSRLTIALLVLTSLALLTLDFRDSAIVTSARERAATVLSPLRGAAEWTSRPFTNAWHGVTGYGDLKSENDELRRQMADLEGRAVLEQDAALQLAELLRQQDLEWVGDIPTMAARVLSGSPSNFSHTVDISKGSRDGVKAGMPVVNGAGLVGRVVLVTAERSTVQLITDPDFAVGVKLLPSNVTGTARGQGRGQDLVVDSRLEPGAKDLPDKLGRNRPQPEITRLHIWFGQQCRIKLKPAPHNLILGRAGLNRLKIPSRIRRIAAKFGRLGLCHRDQAQGKTRDQARGQTGQ